MLAALRFNSQCRELPAVFLKSAGIRETLALYIACVAE